MRDSAIRHLAISDDRSIVAAALFESTVQLWSCKTGEQLAEFETVLGFVGQRLALTRDASTCIAGSWSPGLAAYSVPDRKLLWHRKDLGKIQWISVSVSGEELYCGFESAALAVIELESAKTVRTLEKTLSIVSSPFSLCELVVERNRYRVLARSQRI